MGLLVVALVLAVLPTAPVGSAAPVGGGVGRAGLTVGLDPSSLLVDGQVVAVEVDGALAQGSVSVAQCVAGTDDCFQPVASELPAAGMVSVPLTVHALVFLDPSGIDCRHPGRCDLHVVVAENRLGGTSEHRVPLPFDPVAPLRPLPTVGVSPSTGLDLHDVLRVEVAGLDPSVDPVPVAQCRADDLGPEGCDIAHHTIHGHGGTGSFTIGWGVGSVIETWTGDVDCRADPGTCVLVVPLRIPPDFTSRPVAVPLTFAPGAAAGYPTGGTGAPPPPPPPTRLPPTTEAPPDPALIVGRYLEEVFEGVEARRDIVIWEDAPVIAGSGAQVGDLTIDILVPAGDTARSRPVVVASEGDGFEALVARGYVVVVQPVRSRSAGSGTGVSETQLAQQQAVVDRSAAVRWLRAHATELGIHPDAIVVAGRSFTGAVALSMVWGGENRTDTYHWPFIWSATPPGPVQLPAPADLGPVHREQSSDVAAAVAHITWFAPELIDPGESPAILHHGDDDEVFPPDEVAKICPAATAVGVTCDAYVYDAGHGLGEVDRAVADDRTVLFLYEHVLGPVGIVGAAPSPSPGPVAGQQQGSGSSAAPSATATPTFTG